MDDQMEVDTICGGSQPL